MSQQLYAAQDGQATVYTAGINGPSGVNITGNSGEIDVTTTEQ